MDIITSTTNDIVKEAAKLQQKKYRTENFLLEGLKVIEEAINCNIKINKIFINKINNKLVEKFKNQNIILTNEAVLKKLSTTESAPDIIAVAKQKKYDINLLAKAKKVILLENIKDAGNLGTIIRTAKGLNFDAVVLYGNTVDVYNPKTVRAAVGNLWKLPVIHISDYELLETTFKNFERVATLPKSNIKLKEYTPNYPLLLMFGSEADGLTEELIKFSTENLTIEMNKDVESLNLSISAGIIMYQISSK